MLYKTLNKMNNIQYKLLIKLLIFDKCKIKPMRKKITKIMNKIKSEKGVIYHVFYRFSQQESSLFLGILISDNKKINKVEET